jgi:hypothetical protein
MPDDDDYDDDGPFLFLLSPTSATFFRVKRRVVYSYPLVRLYIMLYLIVYIYIYIYIYIYYIGEPLQGRSLRIYSYRVNLGPVNRIAPSKVSLHRTGVLIVYIHIYIHTYIYIYICMML